MNAFTSGLLLYLLHYASSDFLFQGDICTVPVTNETGYCINLFQCKYAKRMLQRKENPNYCGFWETTPLVCCPHNVNLRFWEAGTMSAKKCNFYYEVHQSRRRLIEQGHQALPREFPHMAAVGFVDNETNNIFWNCGGTLISHYFVLSAAHCAYSLHHGPAKWIRLGELDFNDTTEDASPTDKKITNIYIYPFYKLSSFYHDVALFKMEEWVEFSVFFRPACLHIDRKTPVSKLEATGWGKLGHNGEKSSHLMKVDLRVVDRAECSKKYNTISLRKLRSGIVDKYQICAGDDVGKDTCPGDSGGPLHYSVDAEIDETTRRLIAGHYVVAGITSFGTSCGGPNSVGVYTRVSTYVDWIESIVWEIDEDWMPLLKKT